MTERLSDTIKQAPFACYVLLSEPLLATFDDVLDAADEDYPGMNWGYQAPDGEGVIDTRQDMTLTDTTGTIEFTCLGGRVKKDWMEEIHNSNLFFPRVVEALGDHTDCIRISFNSRTRDTSVTARLKAARQLTCLAAIFAKLPIATAVYVPSAEKVVRPALWVDAVEPGEEFFEEAGLHFEGRGGNRKGAKARRVPGLGVLGWMERLGGSVLPAIG